MALSARCVLASLLVLALLHTSHCLSLRNPFSAFSQILQRPDISLATRYEDLVFPDQQRSHTPAINADSSAANDAEQRHQINGVVTLTDGKYDFTYRPIADGPARGAFTDSRHTRSGWGILHVHGNASYTDEEQMHAAGFLEGWLTAERIYDHFHNMRGYFNMSTSKPIDWLVQQDEWARQQAARNTSDLWVAISAVLTQFDGLLEGYNARVSAAAAAAAALAETAGADGSSAGADAVSGGSASKSGTEVEEQRRRAPAGFGQRPVPPPLTRADLLMVSAVGDLGDLIPALEPKRRPAWHAMPADELGATLAARGKCSALVKVTGDLSDLLLSHSSWYTFAAMQRVYKHYDLPLRHPAIKLRRASFSSYAGELSSDDDFYLLDTGLVVLQTTNDILDASLYELLTPRTLTSWQRVRAANMLSTSGAEFAIYIAEHNSGTCNNQYPVVDLKRFRPRQELQAGLLTVVEQIPGLTVSADKTGTLERGYWPSYNVPYFPEIYQRAGYKAFQEQHAARGPDFAAAVEGLSYQLAPRAALFRRDEGAAADVATLQRLMRSNDWDADAYSGNSSLGAICGRGDVNSVRPVAYGCYDTKATNFAMAARRWAYGVVGPTTGQGNMRPFRWDEQGGRFADVPHLGQPPVFDFQFEALKPWDTQHDILDIT